MVFPVFRRRRSAPHNSSNISNSSNNSPEETTATNMAQHKQHQQSQPTAPTSPRKTSRRSRGGISRGHHSSKINEVKIEVTTTSQQPQRQQRPRRQRSSLQPSSPSPSPPTLQPSLSFAGHRPTSLLLPADNHNHLITPPSKTNGRRLKNKGGGGEQQDKDKQQQQQKKKNDDHDKTRNNRRRFSNKMRQQPQQQQQHHHHEATSTTSVSTPSTVASTVSCTAASTYSGSPKTRPYHQLYFHPTNGIQSSLAIAASFDDRLIMSSNNSNHSTRSLTRLAPRKQKQPLDEEAAARQEEYYNDLMCIKGRIPSPSSLATSKSYDYSQLYSQRRVRGDEEYSHPVDLDDTDEDDGDTDENDDSDDDDSIMNLSQYDDPLLPPPIPTSSSYLPSDTASSSRASLISSNTVVAGNKTTMSASSLLLSSVVCLSVLKGQESVDKNNNNTSNDPMQRFVSFLPPSTKMVRESLDRHLKFHLSRHAYIQEQYQSSSSQSQSCYQPYRKPESYTYSTPQRPSAAAAAKSSSSPVTLPKTPPRILRSSSTFDTLESVSLSSPPRGPNGRIILTTSYPQNPNTQQRPPHIQQQQQQQYAGTNNTNNASGHPVLQISLSDASESSSFLTTNGPQINSVGSGGLHGVNQRTSNSTTNNGSGDASDQVHVTALEFLQEGNVPAALAVYQEFLEKQTAKQHRRKHNTGNKDKKETITNANAANASSSSTSCTYLDAHRADTLSKLAVLCLHAGRNKQAMQYSFEALRLHRETSRPLPAAIATMEVGLIHLATSRAGRSLQSWREAMQQCCVTVGYEHPIVAILLNNIGVLHYEAGDALASTRALEESLELQRNLLKSGVANGSGGGTSGGIPPGVLNHVDYALYQMATTVGNLAMACELRQQYDRATSLLQESLTFYDSIVQADTTLHVRIVEENLDRLSAVRQARLAAEQGRIVENKSLLSLEESTTMDDSDDENNNNNNNIDRGASVDDGDSVHMFGNSDGIPRTKQVTMEVPDIHDYLLLGPISHDLTPRQRVREAVLAWFGRPLEENVLGNDTPFMAYDEMDPQVKAAKAAAAANKLGNTRQGRVVGVPIDVDDESVIDADLCLQQINQQAMEHLDHQEIVDALGLFQSALRSHKDKYGEDHHLVGCTLHNIGLVHLFAEEYLQAYGVFKEAARIRSKALGADHPDVAATLMKIGMLQYAAMDISAAARTFSQIREVYLKTMGYGHPQLAKVMNNMGTIRYEQGDMMAAHRAFEIAYEYQRRLMEENPGNCAVAEMAMAYTLSNIGFLYQRQGDLLGALRLFEAAKVALSRHVTPNDVKFAMIQNNIELLVGKGVEISQCEESSCTINAIQGGPCFGRLPWIVSRK